MNGQPFHQQKRIETKTEQCEQGLKDISNGGVYGVGVEELGSRNRNVSRTRANRPHAYSNCVAKEKPTRANFSS